MQIAPQETIAPIATQDLETYLKASIRSALQRSCSKDCSTEEALQLIDRAWESQKMLWQMRREEALVPVRLEK